MSIISFVKEKQAQFKKYKEEQMDKKELETMARLNALKTERQKLENLRIKERELETEKAKLRDLKREPLNNIFNNIKNLDSPKLKNLKGKDQRKNPFKSNNYYTDSPEYRGPVLQDPKGTGGVLKDNPRRIKGL